MTSKEKSETICVLPWIHSATTSSGSIRVCCTCYYPYGYLKDPFVSTTSYLDIRNHPVLKDIRSNMLRGKEPEACRRCFNRQRSGLMTKRVGLTMRFEDDLHSIVKNTKEDGEINPSDFPIKYYDLRVSNQCNSKCIMCNPGSSSMWGKLQSWDKNLNSRYLQDLLANSKNIKILHLCGGEPLIIKSYTTLIEKLKREAGHIDLVYNTNLTVLPDKIFDTWKHYNLVKLHVSIDGIEGVFEDVRRPSKWKTMVHNLKKLNSKALPGITIQPIATVSIKNVFYIPELLQWLIDQNFKNIIKLPYLNMLYTPSHLSLLHLTDSDKLKIVKKYMKFLEKNPIKEHKKEIISFLDFIKNSDNFNTTRKADELCKIV